TSTAADYSGALEMAVIAAAEGIKAALPGFAASIEQGGHPSVINIASMYGIVSPDPQMYAIEEGRNPPFYGSAKAALVQVARYAAAELGPQGIRVNSISPGPFPGPAAQADPAFVEKLAAKTMLRRVGTPDDLRAAVVFLAAPGSGFMTGANLVIDG